MACPHSRWPDLTIRVPARIGFGTIVLLHRNWATGEGPAIRGGHIDVDFEGCPMRKIGLTILIDDASWDAAYTIYLPGRRSSYR